LASGQRFQNVNQQKAIQVNSKQLSGCIPQMPVIHCFGMKSLKLMSLLLALFTLGILSVQAWSMGEEPKLGLQIVTQNIESITSSNFTVTFETSKPVSGQIRFGTNYDFVTFRKITSAQFILDEKTHHKITIEGLLPQTSYRYQIILRDPKTNEKAESDYYLVTTL
jgi:hypothetical protein